MIRPNVFNQILKELRLSADEIKDIPAVFVAFKLTRDLQTVGADLRMGLEGIEVSVSDFSVNRDGDVQVDYYSQRTEDDRRPDSHGASLMLGYELNFIMNNTWFHQPDLGPQPTEEERRDERSDVRRARLDVMRRERLEAHKHMDDVDLNILRGLAASVYTESLQLMRGYWSVEKPEKQPKRLSEGSVVYNLHERDRLNAAWEVRTKGLTQAQDYELIHLRTGAVETAFSGDYGSEQEWLKFQTRNRGRAAEHVILNDFERDFQQRATTYIEAKYRAKGK